VNDRWVDPDSGEKKQFRTSIVPPRARKSPKVAEVLPLPHLHGLSTGDFAVTTPSPGFDPPTSNDPRTVPRNTPRTLMRRFLVMRLRSGA
jgi:hypothetical protein